MFPALVCAQEPLTATVIDDVTVIDVTTGTARNGLRVVVNGSRITGVGPAASTSAPPNATIVDGRGKFLIPGLWDMHVHFGMDQERMWALFLASGVTGVRDLASTLGFIQMRDQIAAGTVLGPRIIGAGQLIDGKPIVYQGITHETTTPDEARKIVNELADKGVNFIKAYEMLRLEVYEALAQQAKARGLTYVGHLPLMVSLEDAIRLGHKSFEHLRGLEIACSSKADSLRTVAADMIAKNPTANGMELRRSIHSALRPVAFDTYDAAKCNGLIQQMVKAGAWQTPNLVLATQNWFRHDSTDFFRRWFKYLPEATAKQWGNLQATGPNGSAPTTMPRATGWFMRTTKQLFDAGVPVLAGTDFPNAAMVPGPSLHEELALLVRAGLSPNEALKAATINPARFFGMTDSLGTVTAGKAAELVLLDANPLDDIRNVSKVHAVWRGGRYLDRAKLDSMLAKFAR